MLLGWRTHFHFCLSFKPSLSAALPENSRKTKKCRENHFGSSFMLFITLCTSHIPFCKIGRIESLEDRNAPLQPFSALKWGILSSRIPTTGPGLQRTTWHGLLVSLLTQFEIVSSRSVYTPSFSVSGVLGAISTSLFSRMETRAVQESSSAIAAD